MHALADKTWATWLVAALCLTLVLAGQVATDRLAPEGTAQTGRMLGRTGFAYLTGIRTFVAAVLWNRLDPQYHTYYSEQLDLATFMLPTMRLVTWLDPQFVQAYYTGPWILRRQEQMDEAYRFALEGVENNPDSAILWTQLAQFEFIDGDPDEAYDYALEALADDVTWRSGDEEFEGLAILREVFRKMGDEERLRDAEAALTRLREEEGQHEGVHTHEHDDE
jgi:tetratricopeptide (TPR) repeat protein